MASDQFDDLAAEMEDPPNDVPQESSTDEPPVDLFTGVCTGGPLDGQSAESRFPRGFLLVDKTARKVWIYDYDWDYDQSGRAFVVRDGDGYELHDDGPDNRWRAADEGDYDIWAWEVA